MIQRRCRFLLPVVAIAALAGCASTPSPSASQSGPPPGTPSAPTATAPSPEGGTGAPSTAPATPAGSAGSCPVAGQTGVLPSDRLIDLSISSTSTHDVLTFVFEASVPGPAGPPEGTMEAASPPFSFAGSGQAIELLGQHAVQLRFSGMTIASESGAATYHGPTTVKPALPALREAIQYDASEGIVGWYVGYDGPGCVTLARDGNTVSVMIAHPEAPAG